MLGKVPRNVRYIYSGRVPGTGLGNQIYLKFHPPKLRPCLPPAAPGLAPASLRRRCLCPYLVLSRRRVFSSRFHLTKCNKKQTPLSILRPPLSVQTQWTPTHAHGELTNAARRECTSESSAGEGRIRGLRGGRAARRPSASSDRPGYPSSTRRCSQASCRT